MGAGRAWGRARCCLGGKHVGVGRVHVRGRGCRTACAGAGRTWRPGRVAGLSTSSSCVPMAFRALASDAGLPGAPGSEGCR